ncbi:MAG: hypothetical protein NWE82_02585, partial [Candidatus Bathyarchaeota archaeon]|nr:hypothetical protein [Candidatus Bathyarchaeota archaeon]
MAKQRNEEQPVAGHCPKCGAKLHSHNKLQGVKHKSGSAPEIPIHEENFSTLCPGTPKSPVLCKFYYTSEDQYIKDRKSKLG